MLKIIGIVGFAAVMAGCATSSVSDLQSQQVEAKHLLAYQDVPSGEYGVVQIKRDSGMLGAGCRAGIYIDGKLSARVGTSEIARFNVPAGEHLIGIGAGGAGICSNVALREQSIVIKDKAIQRFRLTTDMTGIFLTPTSQ